MPAVWGCLGIVLACDLAMWQLRPSYGVLGLLDETAHAATVVVALGAITTTVQRRTLVAALAGSVLIDLDHIPHALGSHVLEPGIPRPITHSLWTLAILLVIAAVMRRRGAAGWRDVLVATAALALHFFRDMGEPASPGVSLLWPLRDHPVAVPYAVYAAALGVMALVADLRRRSVPRARSGAALTSSGER